MQGRSIRIMQAIFFSSTSSLNSKFFTYNNFCLNVDPDASSLRLV